MIDNVLMRTKELRKYIYLLLFLIFSCYSFAQENDLDFETKIINLFEKHSFAKNPVTKDSLYVGIYGKPDFNVSISDKPIKFDTVHIVLKNPYFSEKYKNAFKNKERVKNLPKSYSVIYKNSLITLFENGKFACYKLTSFERDFAFEKKINTKKFKYHWIIDNQLGAISGNQIYLWSGKKWFKSKSKYPLKDKPKLFEDDEYIIFKDCHGEWGGTVYFYEKSTKKTFFTESTCSNSVIKTYQGYQILANLGHADGHAEVKIIADPRKLTLAKKNQINKPLNGEALGYADKSNAYQIKLDFYEIQLFSSFIINNRELYIVKLPNLTFIAEIKESNIKIVDMLFFKNTPIHNPITTQNDDYILINLDRYYGVSLNREVSVIIIKDSKIIKVDWNESYSNTKRR